MIKKLLGGIVILSAFIALYIVTYDNDYLPGTVSDVVYDAQDGINDLLD